MSGEPLVYEDLRQVALGAVGAGLEQPPREHPDVSGIVVDVPSDGEWMTLAALTDGTTSMYTSPGGGLLGAGSIPDVAAATERLLVAAQEHLDRFTEPDDGTHPAAGVVRFHLLRPDGRARVDVPKDAFWGRVDDPLMPVIAAVQDLVTELSRVPPTS